MKLEIFPFEQSRSGMDGQYRNADFSKSMVLTPDKLWELVKETYFGEQSNLIGKAMALKVYFENAGICINPHDIFADILQTAAAPARLTYMQEKELAPKNPLFDDMTSEGAIIAGSDFGHTMPDWKFLLDNGATGVIKLAEKKILQEGLSKGQREYYLSVKYAYEGILTYMERLRNAALKVDSRNSAFAAHNLDELTHHAPETLAQAMQFYFIIYSAQQFAEGEYVRSLGALDDLLLPFYRKDIASGEYSEAELREYMRYFLYKWNSLNFTANIPFNLCTHTSELTYIILDEYISLDIIDPKIHIKCHADTPARIYETVADSVRSGKNSFVFVNDAVVKAALMGIGQQECDASDYTLIGCYEPASVGKEVPCTCNGRINMPLAVETVLNGGKRFGSDKAIGIDFGDISVQSEIAADFGKLYDAVKKQLAHWANACIEKISGIERLYPKYHRSPIFSATYKESFERGIDIYEGSAKYNNSSVCAFGTATLADELYAIKKAVYEDGFITLSELKKVLQSNWDGNLALRKKLMSLPKYGNNIDEVDAIAADIQSYMASVINNRPNGRGGVFRLGTFSIDWRMEHGKMTGASADGRFSGEPVSRNMCASVGMDLCGVTGVIISATKLDYTRVPNGTVLDIAVHPSAVSGKEGLAVLIGLIKTFLDKGGFALQINVVDAETLRAAKAQPERYKNLQVRLCGWNVYFTQLDEASQDDLIKSIEA